MNKRCYYKSDPDFSRYGGRGIRVCNSWIDNFGKFLRDMGFRPKGKTLDRIYNDKDYSKDNCRWATPKEQANNRRHPSRKKGARGTSFKQQQNGKSWRADITTKGKRIHLGFFTTEEEAHQAYERAK